MMKKRKKLLPEVADCYLKAMNKLETALFLMAVDSGTLKRGTKLLKRLKGELGETAPAEGCPEPEAATAEFMQRAAFVMKLCHEIMNTESQAFLGQVLVQEALEALRARKAGANQESSAS